jgi:lactam utilization protein B
VNKRVVLALSLATIMVGCHASKPPFSRDQFLAAKSQCRALDAYVIGAAPNTIGFHGTSAEHLNQARCLKENLAETDVEIVVLGSQLHQRP